MLRDFSLRDFGASLNTVESYTNESSQGKIGLCETVNKQKCTHLGMFLASDNGRDTYLKAKSDFKKKWLSDNSAERTKAFVDEALVDLKKELYETFDIKEKNT